MSPSREVMRTATCAVTSRSRNCLTFSRVTFCSGWRVLMRRAPDRMILAVATSPQRETIHRLMVKGLVPSREPSLAVIKMNAGWSGGVVSGGSRAPVCRFWFGFGRRGRAPVVSIKGSVGMEGGGGTSVPMRGGGRGEDMFFSCFVFFLEEVLRKISSVRVDKVGRW